MGEYDPAISDAGKRTLFPAGILTSRKRCVDNLKVCLAKGKPVEFSIETGAPETCAVDCLVIGVFEPAKEGKDLATLAPAGQILDRATAGQLSALLAKGDFTARPGTVQLLYGLENVRAGRSMLVGLGKADKADATTVIKAVAATVRALADTGVTSACLTFMDGAPATLAHLAQRAVIAATSALADAEGLREDKKKPRALKKIVLWFAGMTKSDGKAGGPAPLPLAALKQAIAQGEAITQGMTLARQLGNLPANTCTPDYLANTAKKLAKTAGFSCSVLDEKGILDNRMHALLAVARGSRLAPRFITMEYKGHKKTSQKSRKKPVVLIGKGITFDSGGISLKPAAAMDEMKFDMCGAATVLGVMTAAARMKLPLHLVALIPACENMPGGNASRPGDIITTRSGQTVEILNTDAEGRLILCDALDEARQFAPAAIIDIATLTGACAVALGRVAHGLFANDPALSAALMAAGETTHDRAWPMPLWDDYQEALDSPVADMANVGAREGGAVTAACFLSRFVDKKTPWAHLDIAGTAWQTGKKKSATGRPVPLLCQYLITLAASRTQED
jgi:leucyl aminopeptidase